MLNGIVTARKSALKISLLLTGGDEVFSNIVREETRHVLSPLWYGICTLRKVLQLGKNIYPLPRQAVGMAFVNSARQIHSMLEADRMVRLFCSGTRQIWHLWR